MQIGFKPAFAGAHHMTVTAYASSGAITEGTAGTWIVPAPEIWSLSPSQVQTGASTLTITVTGNGFLSDAAVKWNGAVLDTTVVSPITLTAVVSPTLLVSSGRVNVTVVESGTLISNVASFSAGTGGATSSSLSPAQVQVSAKNITLQVSGAAFLASAVVLWNDKQLTTTVVSETQLSAIVPAALISSARTALITVVNGSQPATSPLQFTVTAPAAILGLSPSVTYSGSADFTLTVNGSGFLSSSVINWNGGALPTNYVGSSQLKATIPASLVATTGSASVTVVTGGVVSASSAFTILFAPAVSTLSPASLPSGSPGFTLTVIGTGFTSSSIVQWNGVALATKFVSATTLSANIAPTLLLQPGIRLVTVRTATVSSNSATFTITGGLAVPFISPGGVVPLGSTSSVVQPGSWISIYGGNLSSAVFIWENKFETALGGVSVQIDGKPAYLWFVSPGQINLQVPETAARGQVNVVVATKDGTATATVTIADAAPAFSLFDAKYPAGVILTTDGSGSQGGGTYDFSGPAGRFAFPTRAVKAGETILLFGVGFGPTDPQVPAGQAYSGAAATTGKVVITKGGVPAEVQFSGLVSAGLYQFNVVIPQTASGDQALQAIVAGAKTPNGVVLAVQ